MGPALKRTHAGLSPRAASVQVAHLQVAALPRKLWPIIGAYGRGPRHRRQPDGKLGARPCLPGRLGSPRSPKDVGQGTGAQCTRGLCTRGLCTRGLCTRALCSLVSGWRTRPRSRADCVELTGSQATAGLVDFVEQARTLAFTQRNQFLKDGLAPSIEGGQLLSPGKQLLIDDTKR